MSVTDVTDSPKFWDKTDNETYLCKKCCKQQYYKEALYWYNFNPKGIKIFPYDNKQIILLTSMGYNIL